MTSRTWLLGLIVLTLVVRTGVLLLMPDALVADPDGYRYLAENLLAHGTFGRELLPTAYRPPLYPLALVPCVAMGPAAIGALHVLLGLATVLLVFRLGQRLELGPYALVAAALVACDPILLAQSTQVMTETLAVFLVVATLNCLAAACERPTASRIALAGAVSAAAGLCRPGLLLWAVAAAILLPMFVERPKRLGVFAAFTVAAAVVLAPWVVRNQIQFGRPILATTHGGYTLLLGNNPWFYEYLRSGASGSVWDADELHRSRTVADDELRADREAHAEASRNIRREPGMFCRACLVRIGRLWQPVPHRLAAAESSSRRFARYAVGLWYLIEFCLAVVGAWAVWTARGRNASAGRTWVWGLLLVVCLTAVHAFYWTNMRMRAPLVSVVALAAAAGLARIASTRSRATRDGT